MICAACVLTPLLGPNIQLLVNNQSYGDLSTVSKLVKVGDAAKMAIPFCSVRAALVLFRFARHVEAFPTATPS